MTMTTPASFRMRKGVFALAAAAAMAAAAPASAAPSVQLTSGATTVLLNPEFLGALSSLGVTPANVLPGSLIVDSTGARVAFPIPTGELDAAGPKLEVLHSGGLTLTAGHTRVALTSFIIQNLNGRLQLTGVVKANDSIVGRIPLFNVHLTQAPSVSAPSGTYMGYPSSHLTIRGARVTLTHTAATTLNNVFGISAFTAGFPIGTARVNARVSDLDGK
jgi:hypothetical protein